MGWQTTVVVTGARFQLIAKTKQEKMEKKFMLKKVIYKAMKPWGLMLCGAIFLMVLVGTFLEQQILFRQAIAADIKQFNREILPSNLNQKQQILQKQTTDNSIHTQISEQQLEQQFNQLGILYNKRDTEEKTTYYVADFGKNRALVGLSCGGKENICDLITVYKRFNVTNKPDLRKINQWNLSKGFGTAVIDEEGNPVIKCRYSLYGGVSLKSVNFFLVLSSYVLDEFAKYIEAS